MTTHDNAVHLIEEQLGGEATERTFKVPFGSIKINLRGMPRRPQTTKATVDDGITLGKTHLDLDHLIDWSDSYHYGHGKQLPCIHCKRPSYLLDDAGRPAHKICAETALAKLLKNPERQASTPFVGHSPLSRFVDLMRACAWPVLG
jgi:hypothetical protein